MSKEHIESILEKEDSWNAFIEKTPEIARSASNEGMLAGKTLAIKSCINVKGALTSCASKTLDNYIAPYDATVISKIKSEGGAIIGMANMDEFACGASGETSYYGPTKNPSAKGMIPGGSSSGSAAAVAADLCDMAIGTDTGGSIRNPSSHCGVVGFKPTYGTVSRYGVCDMSMSLEQVGPIAKSVYDAALLLDVISGKDEREATTLDTRGGFSENLNPDLSGKKLGYAKEIDELIVDDGIRTSIHAALDKLKSEGAEIIDVELPSLSISIPTYYLNVYVEFFSATRKYDGRRFGHKIEESCGEEVLRRITLGKYISAAEWQGKYYRKALAARTMIRNELESALKDVDALVAPVVPMLPHKIGEEGSNDPKVMYAYDIFTTPANLAGLPAGSVPANEVNGIPTGLQVIGKPLSDQKVLDVMAGFEAL